MSVNGFVEIRSWEIDFQDLPEEVSRHFNQDESEVYIGGSSALLARLRSINESKFDITLSTFGDECPMRVYVEDLFGDSTVWFGLSNIMLEHEIRIQLPQTTLSLPFALPKRLANLFKSIGALKFGIPYSPILTTPRKNANASATTTDQYSIIRYGNGDAVLTKDGQDFVLWDFAEKKLVTIEINQYVDQFIDDLCQEKDWGI